MFAARKSDDVLNVLWQKTDDNLEIIFVFTPRVPNLVFMNP